MPETSKSSSLYRRAPCTCWGTLYVLNLAFDSPALLFTSCLHTASTSDRNKSLGPFQIFYENAPSAGHTQGLIDPWQCVRAFQSPSWTSHFLFKFFGWSVVCPTFYLPPQAAVMIKQLQTFVFDKIPQRRRLCVLCEL